MAEPAPTQPEGKERGIEPDLGIVDALVQMSFLIQGTLTRYAAAHDLSLIQTRLLGVLRDREPTMQGLSKLLNLDKSSVSGLVDRAEHRGLVRRRPADDDRRMIRVVLAPSGRRLVTSVAEAIASDIRSATASLSEEEQRQLSVLATKVVYEHWASSARLDASEQDLTPDELNSASTPPFRLDASPS
jgi:MarR family transcriptional regulator, lower aerobic nicotinate degradation pathway regulator